jgi:hypothetical protein
MPLSPSISTRLQYQHESLAELVAGLSEERLKTRVVAGKWSPFEQVAHLAAYQPIFLERLNRIHDETDPEFGRYVADEDVAFAACLEQSIGELLAGIERNGKAIFGLVAGWDELALSRTGRHAKYGLMDVAGWAEFYVLHEAHHLFAIFMMTRG